VNGRRYIWKLSSDELAKVRTGIFLNTDVLGILILMLDLVLKKKISQTIKCFSVAVCYNCNCR